MQTSPYEIKDKLLRAIDKEYNVVDMATVLEVISLLEKAIITRETLEKTRIGKYVNELRKRTSNEELARRAKDLVKSWRKLLPPPDSSVNGERVIGSTSSTGSAALTSANKLPKPCGSVPGSPCCKTTSPSVSCEHSTSPFYSSASNSPQLIAAKVQGTSKPLTPSSYAPTKLSQTGIRSDKSNSQNKGNALCSQIFKPVSPALAAAQHANSNIGSSSSAEFLPQPKPRCISPPHLNSSRSCSPHLEVSAMRASQDSLTCQLKNEKVMSPALSIGTPVSLGSAHSSLDIAKTNVANKRLRKDICVNSKTKKVKSFIYDSSCDSSLQNGIDCVPESSERLLPSESSAFKSLSSLKKDSEKKNSKFEKQKSDIPPDLLREKFSSLSSVAKLPKVKTTQQLIEELQAKKDASSKPFLKLRNLGTEADSLPLKNSPNNSVPSAELLRSKSELMKKFLSSSHESPSNSGPESPEVERMSSPLSDNVPSKSSVITPDKDFGVPFTDPVSIEIEQILSTLPPINPEDINLDEDNEPLPERRTITDEDVDKYSQKWEYVNGNYTADGSWRPWQECTESEISAGETLRILPYVNID